MRASFTPPRKSFDFVRIIALTAALFVACAASSSDVITSSHTITNDPNFLIYADYGAINTDWMLLSMYNWDGTLLWGYCDNADPNGGYVEFAPGLSSGVYTFRRLHIPTTSGSPISVSWR